MRRGGSNPIDWGLTGRGKGYWWLVLGRRKSPWEKEVLCSGTTHHKGEKEAAKRIGEKSSMWGNVSSANHRVKGGGLSQREKYLERGERPKGYWSMKTRLGP